MCVQLTYALVEFKDIEDALKAVRMAKVTLSENKLVIKPRVLPSQHMSPSSKHSPAGSKEAKPSPPMLPGDSPKKKPREGGVNIDLQDILQSSEVSKSRSPLQDPPTLYQQP